MAHAATVSRSAGRGQSDPRPDLNRNGNQRGLRARGMDGAMRSRSKLHSSRGADHRRFRMDLRALRSFNAGYLGAHGNQGRGNSSHRDRDLAVGKNCGEECGFGRIGRTCPGGIFSRPESDRDSFRRRIARHAAATRCKPSHSRHSAAYSSLCVEAFLRILPARCLLVSYACSLLWPSLRGQPQSLVHPCTELACSF